MPLLRNRSFRLRQVYYPFIKFHGATSHLHLAHQFQFRLRLIQSRYCVPSVASGLLLHEPCAATTFLSDICIFILALYPTTPCFSPPPKTCRTEQGVVLAHLQSWQLLPGYCSAQRKSNCCVGERAGVYERRSRLGYRT